jgi:hypothetical protein
MKSPIFSFAVTLASLVGWILSVWFSLPLIFVILASVIIAIPAIAALRYGLREAVDLQQRVQEMEDESEYYPHGGAPYRHPIRPTINDP